MDEQLVIPYGFCHCGCSEKTKVAYRNWNKRGIKKGDPQRYIHGHHRPKNIDYTYMIGNKFRKGISPWSKGLKTDHYSGSKHWNWHGVSVKYRGLHKWVAARMGKPKRCWRCLKTGAGRKMHWANLSKKYKRDVLDWYRLCAMCHKHFDMGLIMQPIEGRKIL
jgi:hypothetical protein